MKKNEEGKRSDSSLKRKKTPQNYGRKSEQKISEDPEP